MNHRAFSARSELIAVIVTIGLSMLLLPGLIYVVGSGVFGAYGAAGGIAAMYLTTLTDLAVLRMAAWGLILVPALCVVLLRLIFRLTQHDADIATPTPRRTRREPTLDN